MKRLAWLGLLIAPAALAADVDELAARLAALRGEVETLSSELSLEKEDLRATLRAMDAQKADLQVQVRQQELRLQQLDQALQTEVEAREAYAESTDGLIEPVRDGIEEVRGAVTDGIPFHQGERLAELDALEKALDGGEQTPREVASKLWSFCEDEKRLTQENALDRQVIGLNGQEMLVDIMRLGMVALYFKTDDGRVGRAVKSGDAWTWVEAATPEDTAAILELHDALSKQIRVGLFELPMQLEVSR